MIAGKNDKKSLALAFFSANTSVLILCVLILCVLNRIFWKSHWTVEQMIVLILPLLVPNYPHAQFFVSILYIINTAWNQGYMNKKKENI